MNVLVWPVISCFRKSIAVFKGSQVLPVCPTKDVIKTKLNTEHWWNDVDGEASKYSAKNLFQCQFVHFKPHRDCSGIKRGYPQWEAGDNPAVPWNNLYLKFKFLPHTKRAGIVTRLRVGISGFESWQWQGIFLFSKTSRPGLFPGGKATGAWSWTLTSS